MVYSRCKSLSLLRDRGIRQGKALLVVVLHPDRERFLDIRKFALGSLYRG
jgi:hypothetical protein